MTLFGIGGRGGIPVSHGKITQQAIKTSTKNLTQISSVDFSKIPVKEKREILSPDVIRTATTNVNPTISNETRTILHDALSPRIGVHTTLPPTTNLRPALAPPPRRSYEQDRLNVSQFKFIGGILQPVEKNGISVFRPEIISSMNFIPVTGNAKLGDKDPAESAEQLIKAQFQAAELRAATLAKIIQEMKRNGTYSSQLDAIRNLFTAKMDNSKYALKYFSDLLRKLNTVTAALDPKTIPESYYNQEKYDSLPAFFERRMQYSRNKFGKFSDTKILNQLIADLKGILENYSFSLLNVVDFDRDTDYDPIKIDKTYTVSNNFSFSLESIKSKNRTNIRMNEPSAFVAFLNSLPTNSDDRIKLLTTILSKELRVSRQLGIDANVRVLREVYQQDNIANPFDNICGVVGDTIFDAPLGNRSLASLTYAATTDEGIIILPFENVYVDTQNNRKTYVPGSSYFVDNILNVSPTTGFDTKPYTTYASTFNNVFSDAKNIIENLLELNVFSPTMSPDVVFNHFLTSAANGISGLTGQASVDRSQSFFVALFKLANTDTTLKNMLFEYFLLSGLASVTLTDKKPPFQRLVREVEKMSNFSFAKFNDTDFPNLLGGVSVLRPYIDHISKQIEDRVFVLLYPQTNAGPSIFTNLSRVNNSFVTTEISNAALSGIFRNPSLVGILRPAGISGLSIPPTTSSEISFPFIVGEIKETLVNSVTSTGVASTNMCKEFVDLCVKFDTLASAGGNPIYTIPDDTFRTRFNYLSVSTQMVLVFEILSSISQKYLSCNFVRGTTGANAKIVFDAGLNLAMTKILKEMTADTVSFNLGANRGATTVSNNSPARQLGSLGTFSIRNTEAARSAISSPTFPGIANIGSGASRSGAFNLTIPPVFSNMDLVTTVNSSYFGFGADFTAAMAKMFIISAKSLELKKSLEGNKQRLKDEDTIVKNILHIFEVINAGLTRAKETVANSFTVASMNTFLTATGLDVGSFELVKTPSQIRTSLWLYDQYDERLGDGMTPNDLDDVGEGYIVMDRITLSAITNMFTVLSQSDFSNNNESASTRVKILSVGVPAGFSKNISDRIVRETASATGLETKESDIVNVCVYKKDARFDDIVFKPQKFLFDLSLFPIQKFLPANLSIENVNYGQLLYEMKFKDYENVEAIKEMSLRKINTDDKYSILTSTQKNSLVKNHAQSQFLELYIKLMTGLKITEETFSNEEFSKITSQDNSIVALVISYLKTIRRKNIPNLPLEDLLVSDLVDQETKDIIRVLSYGNIVFQGNFVKKKILDYKLFDRVFHLPVNLDNFEVDTGKTLETDAGRLMYSSANFQSQLKRVGTREYFYPTNKNETSFEDVFVVVESNLRS